MDRINRFISFCQDLGISTPYTLTDMYKADVRWTYLKANAVPHPAYNKIYKNIFNFSAKSPGPVYDEPGRTAGLVCDQLNWIFETPMTPSVK